MPLNTFKATNCQFGVSSSLQWERRKVLQGGLQKMEMEKEDVNSYMGNSDTRLIGGSFNLRLSYARSPW